MKNKPDGNADLTGAGRLTVEAVKGITDLVEAMHAVISRFSSSERTTGITGHVYRQIRGVTDLVGTGLDSLLKRVDPLLAKPMPSPARQAVLAVLNGVLGDYLVAQKNPLAISMALRRGGKPLSPEDLENLCTKGNKKLLLLIHGLCMNDVQWLRLGHNHGEMLAQASDYEPVYLHYNSGRHISENGQELANLLASLTAKRPHLEIDLLTHSMGGLVARSALYYGAKEGMAWPNQVGALVCLGTPHHGAPLERGGRWVDFLLDNNPYTKPFSRLGKLRGPGITDLRYGNIRHEDWQGKQERFGDGRIPTPLPRDITCYAIAGTASPNSTYLGNQLVGDGLVPVDSALGIAGKAAFSLDFPEERRMVVRNCNHFDLLSSEQVADALRRFLL